MALLINIGVAVQLILLFIIPTSDSYISLVVIFLFSIISLISLYYLFVYYYLLPDFKQNILVYLTRLLIAFHGLQIIYHMPIEIVLQCFKKQLIFQIEDHFEIIIIVRQRFNPGILWMIALVEIIAIKTLLKIAPVVYLRLNTLKTKFISLLLPFLVYVLQIFFTSASNTAIKSLLEYHNIEIPNIKQIPNLNSGRNRTLIWVFILALIFLSLEFYTSFLHERIKSSVLALTKIAPVVETSIDIQTTPFNDTEGQHVGETLYFYQPKEVYIQCILKFVQRS